MHQTAQSSKKCFLLNYKKNPVQGTAQLDSKYILLHKAEERAKRSEHTIFGKMIFIACSLYQWKRTYIVRNHIQWAHNFTPIWLCRSQSIHFYELLVMRSIDRLFYHISDGEWNEMLKTKNTAEEQRRMPSPLFFFPLLLLPNIRNEKLS